MLLTAWNLDVNSAFIPCTVSFSNIPLPVFRALNIGDICFIMLLVD